MQNCSFICFPCRCNDNWKDDWENDCHDKKDLCKSNYYNDSYGQKYHQQNDKDDCHCNHKREERKENCHHRKCCFCDFLNSWDSF